MTIAACYVSSEGVVFGTDSTTTRFVDAPDGGGQIHHYNFQQKVFEVGTDSTIGILTWGLGNLPEISYRTIIASFSDSLNVTQFDSIADVAHMWSSYFWEIYRGALKSYFDRTQELLNNDPVENMDELTAINNNLFVGFCIGGHTPLNHNPAAFQISCSPLYTSPKVDMLSMGMPAYWGVPNLMDRLIAGVDTNVLQHILNSGKWTGTDQELVQIAMTTKLNHPSDLPIRDAIDWVHTSIYTTIQAMKFSHMPPVCGGPIEVAVITTDRPFRWVKHKRLDAAIRKNEVYHE